MIKFAKAASFAIVVTLLAVSTAHATFYLDVKVDPATAGYTAPYSYTVASSNYGAGGTPVTLDVYALVEGAAPNTTTDTFQQTVANFIVASSQLKGDMAWGSWNATFSGAGSSKGTQFISTYGDMGLGGTSPTVTTSTVWWASQTPGPAYLNGGFYVNATGGSLASSTGAVGVEFLLGTLTTSFSAYTLPASGLTANLVSQPNAKWGLSAQSFKWQEEGTTVAVSGTASQVASGGTANILFQPSGGHSLQFTTGGTVSTAVADISAALAVSGVTTGIGGAVLPLTGNVTNIGDATSTLNWNSSAPGAFTITPSSGATVQGTPTSLSGNWTLPSGRMGTVTGTVTFTGSDSVSGAAVTHSPVAVPVSAYVTGHSTTSFAGSDGTGTPGGPYYNLVSTQTAQNIAGLGATLGNSATSYGIGSTSMEILAGNLVASVSASWRPRSAGELPSNPPHAPGYLPLYSDVLNLNGVTTGTPYVLQMTYDPNQLGTTSPTGGALYLGYRSTTDGNWHYATAPLADGNTGNNATAAQQDYIGSFASFTGTYGTTLTSYMGAWGVVYDTAHQQYDVWAVVNHDAEFAAVPEPGTIALLVGGLLALGVAYRRRFAK